MDETINTRLLPLCHRLATALASEDGASAFRRLLRSANAAERRIPQAATDASTSTAHGTAGRVAIWEPTSGNGNATYRRRPNSTRRFWADIEEIPAKSRRQRIVIVGESVARGLFYDPHYNPACVLKSILRLGMPAADAEVVDLAGIDLTLAQLWKLICSSLVLKPDLLLVFAGNNWNPYTSIDSAGLLSLCEHVRQSGDWFEARALMEKKLANDVNVFLDALGRLSIGHGIPVVVMIPEYNLRDWRAGGQTLPSLALPELMQWLSLRTKAEQALAEQDPDLASTHLAAMLSLDREEVASSLELKARTHLIKGQTAEARCALERARDTALNFPFTGAPGCFSIVQKNLRTNAPAKELFLVDLPAVFETYLEGGIPDRRLFLDYCHMSSEAIRLSMAAAAQPIFNFMGQPEVGQEGLQRGAEQAPPRVEALAHLFAAQHNFNWGQRDEIIRYHLSTAIAYDRSVAPRMLEFLDFHTRRAIPLACKSFCSFAAAEPDFAEYYLNGLSHERRSKLSLIDAALNELGTTDPTGAARIFRLRQTEHALRQAPVDLLDEYYSKGCYSDLTARLKSNSSQHRSFELTSRFFLILERARSVRFTLSYRVPGPTAAAHHLSLSVNQRWTHDFKAGNVWRTATFVTPAEQMQAGVNSLDICWPVQSQSWIESASRALESGDPELIMTSYRPFGEINVFRAQPVEEAVDVNI